MENPIVLDIGHFNAKGHGIGYLNGAKVEVIGAIPGDRVEVELGRKRRGAYKSFLKQVIQNSSQRTAMRCAHAPSCGGCTWQQLDYASQLREKQARVLKIFEPLLQQGNIAISPIIACPSPWEYRNKMEFSFSQNRAGDRFLGLILSGTRGWVFNVQECHLVSPWFAKSLEAVRGWWKESGLHAYQLHRDEGSLRTLILREGKRTGEKMAMLTVSGNPAFALTRTHLDTFITAMQTAIPGPLSLFLRIQQQIKGTPTQFYEMHLAGPEHIHEVLNIGSIPLTFKISPTSFFQPNPFQAEVLYSQALQMLGDTPRSLIFDLYCGTASLSLALASKAKQVIGIELNPHAVFDAESNIALNGIQTVRVLCGDVGTILHELRALPSFTAPDLVVVDPPRAGLNPEALGHLLSLQPKEILYISCQPKTQYEDILALYPAGYQLSQLQPVDQFPHTLHIENIAFLQKA